MVHKMNKINCILIEISIRLEVGITSWYVINIVHSYRNQEKLRRGPPWKYLYFLNKSINIHINNFLTCFVDRNTKTRLILYQNILIKDQHATYVKPSLTQLELFCRVNAVFFLFVGHNYDNNQLSLSI